MSFEIAFALIFAGFERRSIIPVIPPHFKASETTFQPCMRNFVTHFGSIPSATILS